MLHDKNSDIPACFPDAKWLRKGRLPDTRSRKKQVQEKKELDPQYRIEGSKIRPNPSKPNRTTSDESPAIFAKRSIWEYHRSEENRAVGPVILWRLQTLYRSTNTLSANNAGFCSDKRDFNDLLRPPYKRKPWRPFLPWILTETLETLKPSKHFYARRFVKFFKKSSSAALQILRIMQIRTVSCSKRIRNGSWTPSARMYSQVHIKSDSHTRNTCPRALKLRIGSTRCWTIRRRAPCPKDLIRGRRPWEFGRVDSTASN